MRYFILFCQVFDVWCVFEILSVSLFGLDIFQVLNTHTWLIDQCIWKHKGLKSFVKGKAIFISFQDESKFIIMTDFEKNTGILKSLFNVERGLM